MRQEINIMYVEQALRDLLMPTTDRMAELMGRPRVVVNEDTINESCEALMGLPSITCELVAEDLAERTGYRLNEHDRWDWHPENCKAGLIFEPIEPQDDPTCPNCGHYNAIQRAIDRLKCRDCGHVIDIVMAPQAQEFTFTIHFTTECDDVMDETTMAKWLQGVFADHNDLGRVEAMAITQGHNPVGNTHKGKLHTFSASGPVKRSSLPDCHVCNTSHWPYCKQI